MEDLDVDMEELESRLYSQVYHSSVENQDPEPSHQLENVNLNVNTEFKRPRYFELPKKPISKPVTSAPEFIPITSNVEYQPEKENSSFKRYCGEQSIGPPRFSTYNNNIVVIPQFTESITPVIRNKNLEKFLKRQEKYEAKKLKNMERRKRNKQRKLLKKQAKLEEEAFRKEQNKLFVEHCLSVKPETSPNKTNETNNVVILSESDNSDCEEIIEKRELVVLSSDEEIEVKEENIDVQNAIKIEPSQDDLKNKSIESLKSKSDDDVIFIEPEPKHIEIIEIDCDSVGFKDDEKHSETASTNSDLILKVPHIPQKRVRRDLRTPDSTASNDFLDATVDLHNPKFNFSLHGTDFGNSNSNLNTKVIDMSETDSTVSDATVSKSNHFNTIDFETPTKGLFNDTSLELFGDYITPTRDDSKVVQQHDFERICTKASKKILALNNSSDSSSESDYDEGNLSYLGSKELPHLSSVQRENLNKDIDLNQKEGTSYFDYKDNQRENNVTVKGSNEEINDNIGKDGNNDKDVKLKNDKNKDDKSKNDNKNKDDTNKDDHISNNQKGGNIKDSKNKDGKINKDDKIQDGYVCKETDKEGTINIISVQEIPSDTTKDLLERKKRKSEDFDTANKKRKTEKESSNEKDSNGEDKLEKNNFSSDLSMDNNPSFIVIDECDDVKIVEDHDSDCESYFSCDDFNNITTDLKLGNCDENKRVKESTAAKEKSVDEIDFNTFSVEEIQRTMSDDPQHWKVLDVDRLHFRYETPRGPRCNRCRQIGHMALHCTNKQGPRPCILCGERGHQDPRCPLAMCTSCGRLGAHTTYCSRCAHWQKLQCKVCKLYGHIETICPDLWRRYHLTTKPGPIVKPNGDTFKKQTQRWCSFCSKWGHFENTCRYNNRTHFSTNPQIQYYTDLYDFPKDQPFIYYKEETEPVEQSSNVEKETVDVVNKDNKTIADESFHDAESGSPDVENNKVDQNLFDKMYFNIDFPPSKYIPDYFIKQMDYLKRKYLRIDDKDNLKNTNNKASEETNFNTHSKSNAENVNTEIDICKVNDPPRIKYQRSSSGYNDTVKLNYLQLAYIHTEQGIDYFNNIRRRSGVELIIDKYDDLPGGEIYLKSSKEIDVSAIRKEILRFLRNMPCIQDMPEQSKDMLNFLEKHKEMLDKAEGNCWTLCKRLCKISDDGRKEGYNPETAKLKASMQVTIQLLLYGRLNFAEGKEHVNNLHKWINHMKNRPNYKLPLNDIYNIHNSFSYLFEPRKSIFPFKNICSKHDHYIAPTSDNQKKRKIPPKNRAYFETKRKYVIDACERHNLPNNFRTELKSIQNALETSQFSRSHYGDFLRFMTRFRVYMKKHKIS